MGLVPKSPVVRPCFWSWPHQISWDCCFLLHGNLPAASGHLMVSSEVPQAYGPGRFQPAMSLSQIILDLIQDSGHTADIILLEQWQCDLRLSSLQYDLHGLPFKSIYKFQLVQNATAQAIIGDPREIHVRSLFCELYHLDQFASRSTSKCWLLPLKPSIPWLSDKSAHLDGISHFIHTGRRGILRTPSAKEFWLAGSRRKALSAVAPTPWNIPPSLPMSYLFPPIWPSKRPWRYGCAN